MILLFSILLAKDDCESNCSTAAFSVHVLEWQIDESVREK